MSSTDPVRPPAAAGPPDGEFSLSKGASIGRYIILGVLGRGGMGEVYAAYDPELNRKIAIKLLRARADAATASGRTRLLREAQAIARLSHPNVVVVYDVGTFQDTVFIAMEFLEGHTLGYWLQAKQRSWREILDVFLLAGRGLVAAHAAGLVHRDFKPDNVMITKTGQVRVMDFGLAREESRDGTIAPLAPEQVPPPSGASALVAVPGADIDVTMKLDGIPASEAAPAGSGANPAGYLRLKLTRTGALLGTPAYMAPEQFSGGVGDARTDQFSFSVALYEGLYGRRPFAGNDVVTVMNNVVAGRLTDAPENSHVPGWIRKVLLRGMATKLDDRFPTMADLLEALSRDPRCASATGSPRSRALPCWSRSRSGDSAWPATTARFATAGRRAPRPPGDRCSAARSRARSTPAETSARARCSRRWPACSTPTSRAGPACTPRPARPRACVASSPPRCSISAWSASTSGWPAFAR